MSRQQSLIDCVVNVSIATIRMREVHHAGQMRERERMHSYALTVLGERPFKLIKLFSVGILEKLVRD